MHREQQLRAEREKRGSGAGETYVPYIQVKRGEFTSRGRSHIFPSALFSERQHHLLSDLELYTLWKLQTARPRDIREQFPLQWYASRDSFGASFPYAAGTVEIAHRLGVKHPQFGKDDPKRMTTDFVVDHQNGAFSAVHVKPSLELPLKRNMELRAIEEAYWAERSTPLLVVTEEHIDSTEIVNLAMALTFNQERLADITSTWTKDLTRLSGSANMLQVAASLAERFGGSADDHINRIKYAIAAGFIRLNLRRKQLIWSEQWPDLLIPSLEVSYDRIEG